MLLFYHSLLAHIQVEIQAIHTGAVQHSDHNRAVLLLNETAGILDIVAEQAHNIYLLYQRPLHGRRSHDRSQLALCSCLGSCLCSCLCSCLGSCLAGPENALISTPPRMTAPLTTARVPVTRPPLI